MARLGSLRLSNRTKRICATRHPRSFRPRLESLEGRALMSINRIGAITYLDGATQRIYAFEQSLQNHLVLNYWNGINWSWRDQGTPGATSLGGDPGVITYRDSAGQQRIYAFNRG